MKHGERAIRPVPWQTMSIVLAEFFFLFVLLLCPVYFLLLTIPLSISLSPFFF
jgi:hypothetical protein